MDGTEASELPKIGLICQSNLNRSMESHALLLRKGFKNVRSFGAGSKIRLPGEAAHKPNVYDFGTTYDEIVSDLKKKNETRYERNGMLKMLERDKTIKIRPERWQDEKEHFDLAFTYDKRVFENVIADIESRRSSSSFNPIHIINIETPDSHTEAVTGADITLLTVEKLSKSSDWENDLTNILDFAEKEFKKPMLHVVQFY